MVSIVIPTYNRAHVISRALGSIKNQTFIDWECLVVDDGSIDDTHKVVQEYVNNDNRYHFLINQHSKGAPGARKTGIENAKGDCVLLFDSDNSMHANCLEKMYPIISRGFDVCTCWSNVVDNETKTSVGSFKWKCYDNIHDGLFEGTCYADNNSSLIKRLLLIEFPLDEKVPAYQEWDTHIQISNKAKYYTCEEFLVDYFRGGADAISSCNKKSIQGYIYILSKYKDEWLKYHRAAFVRYSSFLLGLISKNDKQQYNIAFKELVPKSLMLNVYLRMYYARTRSYLGSFIRQFQNKKK